MISGTRSRVFRRPWAPNFRKFRGAIFKSLEVVVAPSLSSRTRQPLERSIRVRSPLVSAMSACCVESTSAAGEKTASIAADGPTFDTLVLSAQARHTARLSGKYETECPLYGQEGSKRSEGRAVRPTWRTHEKTSQINALSFRRWGNCRGIPYIPPRIPRGFAADVPLRPIGQARYSYCDPLNISAHATTHNRTHVLGGASHLP